MTKVRTKPIAVALTIAGSDSGGGAGIQADLKTFAALGVHGASAITCITAQNPKRVLAIQACGPAMVRRQLEAVFSELPPAAIKTGMLFSAEIIRVVAGFFRPGRKSRLVVDPVMLSTSGSRLLQADAVRCLTRLLIPRALLVTPNLAEAGVLSGIAIKSVEDMRQAAQVIQDRFGCAALVKGGHLRNTREAADILRDGPDEWLLSAPFIRGIHTHGTGCTYSAAIAAYLALGCELREAVFRAKEFVSNAIANSRIAGRHSVLCPQ